MAAEYNRVNTPRNRFYVLNGNVLTSVVHGIMECISTYLDLALGIIAITV